MECAEDNFLNSQARNQLDPKKGISFGVSSRQRSGLAVVLRTGIPSQKRNAFGLLIFTSRWLQGNDHPPDGALDMGVDVNDTSLFLTLSGTAAVLVSAYIFSNPFAVPARANERAFYWFSIAFSATAFLWVTSDALGLLAPNTTSSWWFRVVIYRGWLVIGTAVSCALLLILNSCVSPHFIAANNAARTFLTSPYVVKGISVSVSVSFLCTEIGKLAHDADMRQFFRQSGYPVWFLYSEMIAETVGSVGLLFARTVTLAALGLSGIMAGAIATHVHNRDAFSDSLEALHLLVLLACILVIQRFQRNCYQQTMTGSY